MMVSPLSQCNLHWCNFHMHVGINYKILQHFLSFPLATETFLKCIHSFHDTQCCKGVTWSEVTNVWARLLILLDLSAIVERFPIKTVSRLQNIFPPHQISHILLKLSKSWTLCHMKVRSHDTFRTRESHENLHNNNHSVQKSKGITHLATWQCKTSSRLTQSRRGSTTGTGHLESKYWMSAGREYPCPCKELVHSKHSWSCLLQALYSARVSTTARHVIKIEITAIGRSVLYLGQGK
jgi:hypothetical protein